MDESEQVRKRKAAQQAGPSVAKKSKQDTSDDTISRYDTEVSRQQRTHRSLQKGSAGLMDLALGVETSVLPMASRPEVPSTRRSGRLSSMAPPTTTPVGGALELGSELHHSIHREDMSRHMPPSISTTKMASTRRANAVNESAALQASTIHASPTVPDYTADPYSKWVKCPHTCLHDSSKRSHRSSMLTEITYSQNGRMKFARDSIYIYSNVTNCRDHTVSATAHQACTSECKYHHVLGKKPLSGNVNLANARLTAEDWEEHGLGIAILFAANQVGNLIPKEYWEKAVPILEAQLSPAEFKRVMTLRGSGANSELPSVSASAIASAPLSIPEHEENEQQEDEEQLENEEVINIAVSDRGKGRRMEIEGVTLDYMAEPYARWIKCPHTCQHGPRETRGRYTKYSKFTYIEDGKTKNVRDTLFIFHRPVNCRDHAINAKQHKACTPKCKYHSLLGRNPNTADLQMKAFKVPLTARDWKDNGIGIAILHARNSVACQLIPREYWDKAKPILEKELPPREFLELLRLRGPSPSTAPKDSDSFLSSTTPALKYSEERDEDEDEDVDGDDDEGYKDVNELIAVRQADNMNVSGKGEVEPDDIVSRNNSLAPSALDQEEDEDLGSAYIHFIEGLNKSEQSVDEAIEMEDSLDSEPNELHATDAEKDWEQGEEGDSRAADGTPNSIEQELKAAILQPVLEASAELRKSLEECSSSLRTWETRMEEAVDQGLRKLLAAYGTWDTQPRSSAA
ncbi:hypothetical protein H0H87_000541 [Tephrocybe sp. NHM501043]|nr:hypothetical protein H0H87_000541 [Tephrocybe sp. NHM501043]